MGGSDSKSQASDLEAVATGASSRVMRGNEGQIPIYLLQPFNSKQPSQPPNSNLSGLLYRSAYQALTQEVAVTAQIQQKRLDRWHKPLIFCQ